MILIAAKFTEVPGINSADLYIVVSRPAGSSGPHSLKMSSIKRKALGSQLQRRVRARRDPSPELVDDIEEDSGPEEEGFGGRGSEDGSEPGSDEDASREEDEEDEEEEDSDNDSEPEEAATISFGALAKAQQSLEKSKDKKGSKTSTTVRKNGKSIDDTWNDFEAAERKKGRKDDRDFHRTSKHAPTEVSSKKAVSRRREVVVVQKRQVRDPRFEPLAGHADEQKFNKAYSFLNDYRKDETKQLKDEIRKTKDESKKAELKRTLHSMESKMKAAERKQKEQEILDRHRKEEKELVAQGKKPFYLKKAEQKKQLILEQYKGLKGKQLDHVIERRRKKVDAKEKKNLPFARRAVGGDA
jgi:ribosomal RNA-processing protein 36